MQAAQQYKNEKYQSAYVHYAVLAEMGYSIAQANVAELLERHEISINGESAIHPRALMYLERAANQNNFEARLKVGDYVYYGRGTEENPSKAAYHYRIAAEHGGNGQAFFNLGWMHQNGVGLEKDNPLAKRYYDHALEVTSEAYLPCSLALLSLATEDYQKYLKQLMSGVTIETIQTQISDLVLLYVGPEWDIFLAIFLLFILAFVIMFRRQ